MNNPDPYANHGPKARTWSFTFTSETAVVDFDTEAFAPYDAWHQALAEFSKWAYLGVINATVALTEVSE